MDACTCRGSERRAEGGLGPDPGIRRLLGARCQQEDLRARPSLMRLLAACNEAFCSCRGGGLQAILARAIWDSVSSDSATPSRTLPSGPRHVASHVRPDLVCHRSFLQGKEAQCGACQRPPCDDGHHRHVTRSSSGGHLPVGADLQCLQLRILNS